MLFLTAECEVVTLTNEPTWSNENKNKFYVGITLSISTVEISWLKTLSFVKNDIFLLDITPCMLVAICRPTDHTSKFIDHPLKKGYSRNIMHVKMQLISILDRCDIKIKELK